MHGLFLHNDRIRRIDEPVISAGQAGFLTGWGIFSTLRINRGILFAFERHYARMKTDAGRMRVPFPYSPERLQAQLRTLIDANQVNEGVMRVSVVRNTGGAFDGGRQDNAVDLIAFTAPLRDWGTSVVLDYIPGARLGRSRFAGAKVTSWAENLTLYEEAHERGLDEYILLDENGSVSECTSANIFLMRRNQVLTPPLGSSGCLPGVTRAILLEAISIPGLTIREAEISPLELESGTQVFITSSTRELMAVREIAGNELQQDPATLNKLQEAFARYRENYIASRQHESAVV